MTQEIHKTMQLTASLERVWRAITEADEIRAWFPESIERNCELLELLGEPETPIT